MKVIYQDDDSVSKGYLCHGTVRIATAVEVDGKFPFLIVHDTNEPYIQRFTAVKSFEEVGDKQYIIPVELGIYLNTSDYFVSGGHQNSIIVYDIRSMLEHIKERLAELDKKQRGVSLVSSFWDVKDAIEKAGYKFLYNKGYYIPNPNFVAPKPKPKKTVYEKAKLSRQDLAKNWKQIYGMVNKHLARCYPVTINYKEKTASDGIYYVKRQLEIPTYTFAHMFIDSGIPKEQEETLIKMYRYPMGYQYQSKKKTKITE